MKSITLYTKIDSLPKNLREEVNDFMEFLLARNLIKKRKKKRKAGFLKGKIEIDPSFKDPLDDFNEYMP